LLRSGIAAGMQSRQFIAPRIVPGTNAASSLQFSAFLVCAEPIAARCVSYRGTASAVNVWPSIRAFPESAVAERFQMTLTVAHISPIISLIAGVLILIMPRLLNLVVAIYLILNGLIGLGLLRWLHL
jgi:Protein of unknown function (DUF3096)